MLTSICSNVCLSVSCDLLCVWSWVVPWLGACGNNACVGVKDVNTETERNEEL